MPERFISGFEYKNSVIAEMIIAGKYNFIQELFQILGALTAHAVLVNQIDTFPEELKDYVVCPIPLHKQKLRWRGFNQVAVAGEIIAQALELEQMHLLTRVRNTQTQKDLDAKDRMKNVAGAFSAVPNLVRGVKNVILVDDVATTGQTFLEATKALKQAGVQTVWCLSIAKD